MIITGTLLLNSVLGGIIGGTLVLSLQKIFFEPKEEYLAE